MSAKKPYVDTKMTGALKISRAMAKVADPDIDDDDEGGGATNLSAGASAREKIRIVTGIEFRTRP